MYSCAAGTAPVSLTETALPGISHSQGQAAASFCNALDTPDSE